MKRVLASLLFLVLPLTALADGKVFSTALEANVRIPDQRALIHFTNGTERLVIETRFTGSGTNFAWVVPLPDQPIIEEASTGLFPTLQYLFQPQIRHDIPRYYAGILMLMGVAYLLLFVRRTGRMNWLDIMACVLVGIGAGVSVSGPKAAPLAGYVVFVVVSALLICYVGLVRLVRLSAGVIFALVLLAFLFFAMLPSFAVASKGASISSDPAVSILDRRLVGVFDTTTISSRDGKALPRWLRDNGFAVSTNSEPVIESYARDGWVFVATKVRRDRPEHETSTPHPLSFTFKTDKPVYPMRLTGVDNGPLEVELYVFGSARAAAPRFKVECCTRPTYPELPAQDRFGWPRWLPETPSIVHPLLRKWVDGSAVATKLRATLLPTDLHRDVWLSWTPFSEKRNAAFSQQGALTVGLNWGTGIFAMGVFVGYVRTWRDKSRKRTPAKLIAGVAAFGIILAGTVYLSLPKTAVRLVRNPVGNTERNLLALAQQLPDMNSRKLPEMTSEAQRLLASPTYEVGWSKWFKSTETNDWHNYILGGRIREEDSPGNFTLRENSNKLEFVVYDVQGAEHVWDF